MEIITDSREQILIFGETINQKLDVADYTTVKLLGKFHIERKSPADLYGTLIQGHARFKRELERGVESGTKIVMYIECTKSEFISKKFKYGWKLKMKPGTLAKIVNTMEEKYNLEFNWCDGVQDMKDKMVMRFMEEESRLS